MDFSTPESRSIFLGVVLGLAVGKPVGILLVSWVAGKARRARMPDDVTLGQFIGGACLCGVGDTVAMLLADEAFPQDMASTTAKVGVLAGSVLAAAIGSTILLTQSRAHGMSPVKSESDSAR